MIWQSEQTSNRKSEEKPQSFARDEVICSTFIVTMITMHYYLVVSPYHLIILAYGVHRRYIQVDCYTKDSWD
ncbi:Uncharacterized protein TCM_031789 [Theobroma cacao]|uniref:Uncharacterized protein n=1 Tax=Theobroma cacao TaxID=3641 RepID=A0A061F8A9_THECC|nr:Uncharacterized protein TCM_031789 [Theobroma cacao]